ncbi:MAG: sce7726 family protein [Pseudomonadota bacterium]
MIERDIKAALVDRLVERGDLAGDAVVVNEMAVADKERRADLVVANGKLQAFEIKSDADKLDRLEGQIGTFLAHFDKVTIVCGSKHTNSILDQVSAQVEVWVVTRSLNGVQWKQARRGISVPVSDRDRIISFLPKKEAIRALRAAGISCAWDTPRAELIYWAEKMPVSALKNAVLDYVKSRYAEVNKTFMRRRSRRGTRPSHIELLSLYREERRGERDEPSIAFDLDNEEQTRAASHPLAIDITKLPGACKNETGPIFVIPRG